jgi:hypothetical protein
MNVGLRKEGGVKRVLIVLGAVLITSGCSDSRDSFIGPTTPPPLPLPVPAPTPAVFPLIQLGEIVRFQFTADDVPCVGGGGGRCRSYNVTTPSDGQLEVALTSVSLADSFVATTEMYVVPGGDSWSVGPGSRISVTIPVRSGNTYEIRMYSERVPSVELELRAALQ